MEDGLKTGRVMVKDEDVCLHCGLCAERCPTAAWDMQQFWYNVLKADHKTYNAGSTGSICETYPLTANRRGACHCLMSDQTSVKTNDFVVRFANVNGTGSASANALFTKAVFRMGVPVTAKNIFPSNIQGLPTWYEVRVSEKGYLGRREGIDLMVCVNPQSMAKDYHDVRSGRIFFVRQL